MTPPSVRQWAVGAPSGTITGGHLLDSPTCAKGDDLNLLRVESYAGSDRFANATCGLFSDTRICDP